MKFYLAFFMSCLLASSSFAYAKDLRVTVNGMVCSFCAQGIQKKFSAQTAVKSVDVNLEDHLVKVVLKDDADLTDDIVTEILVGAGYTVSKIERN